MSRLADKPSVTDRAVDVPPPPLVQRQLIVTWLISRAAAAAASLAEPDRPGCPRLELSIPYSDVSRPRQARITASIVDGKQRRELPLDHGDGPAALPHDQTNDSTHGTPAGLISLDAPGLARLTLRRTGDSLTILYARCDLFGRLGIPGGRYELDGARLAPAD